MPDSIQRYEREYRKDFLTLPKYLPAVSKTELIDAVRNSDVTLVADLHTFDQAQRTARRLMREAIPPQLSLPLGSRAPMPPIEEKWFIGLEMIPSSFQSALDDFQSEKITLEEFHEIISYDTEWGFPWRNYSHIFDWARENKVQLVALNRPKSLRGSSNELKARDEWAAGIITDLFCAEFQKRRRPKMIVLYGELHLGSRHIPKILTKTSKALLGQPLTCLTLHQNEDRLYWKLAEEGRELNTAAVSLNETVYCVFSGTPWARLQSIVSWAEGGNPDLPEDDQDFLSILKGYGTTISELIGVGVPSFETIHVCTIQNASILENIERNHPFSRFELQLIRFHVRHNQRLYIPRARIAYLGSPSYNGAAELAAIHLLRTRTRTESLYSQNTDDFFRLVLEASFGFFGSMILNPRRKCDLIDDHHHRLSELNRGEKPTFPCEEKARQMTIDLWNKKLLPSRNLKALITDTKSAPASMMSAKYLGRILGKILHQALLEEAADSTTIQGLFLKSPDGSQHYFEENLSKLFQLISKMPFAQSKLEEL